MTNTNTEYTQQPSCGFPAKYLVHQEPLMLMSLELLGPQNLQAGHVKHEFGECLGSRTYVEESPRDSIEPAKYENLLYMSKEPS